MDVQQRFTCRDLDTALHLNHDDEEEEEEEEELPGYEASTPPAYNSCFCGGPVVSYHLRRFDRKIQTLVAAGPSTASSYRITTHWLRLFSKKPEMEVLYTSPEMRQRNIASIWFDRDGPLPWRPRAHFDYTDDEGIRTRLDMESANFSDWSVVIGRQSCEWRVKMSPVGLVLVGKESGGVIARFTYSVHGAQAVRGAEAGHLEIQQECLAAPKDGVDKVVCSLMVALTQLRRMGRQYSNAGREQWPLRQGSGAGESGVS